MSDSAAQGMHFEPSSEYNIIRKQLDEFIKQEVEPLEDEYEHFLGADGEENRAAEDGRMDPEFFELTKEIRKKSAEAGYLTMHIPEEAGGGGVSTLHYCMLLDHVYDRHPDGFHGYVLAHGPEGFQGPNPSLMSAYHDEYQREKYFEPMMNVDKEFSFALTEPGHGSDVTWMDSNAEQDGDEWVLNGSKCFISNAPMADFFVVSVRTSGEDGSAYGISSFFVDADNPGIEVGKYQHNMGEALAEHAFVHLDDCRVPDSQMIGEEGKGFFETAINYVGVARLTLAAFCCGYAQWMFDASIEYAEDRKTFGEPIGSNQFVQGMLSELRIDLEFVRWLYRHAAWKIDQGESERWLASAAKWKGSELWNDAADTAVQIHGGSGVMDSLPFAYQYKKSRAPRIYDGTNEIQKRNIARQFLDLD
ncbi:acyl-CoA dehydrogenase family protein [Halorubellus litoreus]|uniref:Acyl-CoA dehydrogenase family protein n=1 Tax=Halorubellus litoreus TaxID=755308 RepID=A0ABD5VJ48_9EURY